MKNSTIANRLIGTLDPFCESGTEGIIWSFTDNDSIGWEALNILKDGDYLFIENGKGGIEWEGLIKFNYTTGLKEIPTNPEHKKQEVMGYWVNGVHEDVKPERWAKWFFEARPAVLIKGAKNVTPTTE